MQRSMRTAIAVGLFTAASVLPACGGALRQGETQNLADARRDGQSSKDETAVGRWLVAELLEPGGDATRAKDARAKLGKTTKDVYASLGKAMYDEGHGDPESAADAYVSVLVAAREVDAPLAHKLGWLASHKLLAYRGTVKDLYLRHRAELEQVLRAPGNVGWRAVAELTEWSLAEAFDKGRGAGAEYDERVAAQMGCMRSIRIAGPFGSGMASDRLASFPAERAPWPPSWPADARRGTVPHVVSSERHRCLVSSTERAPEGVYYAESFISSPRGEDVILAVQGSLSVWVDDVRVLARDLREWGVWPRFGAALKLGPGRHRVLARLTGDSASVRVLKMDGTPANVTADMARDAGSQPYGLSTVTALPDPNALTDVVAEVRARKPTAQTSLALFAAAYLAHAEGQDDLASALLDPLATAQNAAALPLEYAAAYASSDPIYGEDSRHAHERELHVRANAKDPSLWGPAAWLALDDAQKKGLSDAVEPFKALVERFPRVPELRQQLAAVYAKLGYRPERMRALAELVEKFPNDVRSLQRYAAALEEDGSLADADKVQERIAVLEPDAALESEVDRALARHEWDRAIAALRRIEKRHPDKKDVAGRVADVLRRAGDPSAAAKQLEKALAKSPDDSAARFRLADRSYAKGDLGALRRALAELLLVGGKAADLRDAVELVEGASALEPYRIDGRRVVAEYKEWEKGGRKMEGVAARILDYSAVLVHPDGSSEMLEHEVQRIQSQEAIGKEAEQKMPDGLVLNFRVIKPNGAVLEPEPVAGKPTLTMPHLEVGDIIEMEHITQMPSESLRGLRYRGPHWFFREPDKGYWRSEFVVVSPKDRPLEIETHGKVPDAVVKDRGTFTERRWRVDESPPAPDEPDAAPAVEFLPSVRAGWGVSLDFELARFADAAIDQVPLDPRLAKTAYAIVEKAGAKTSDDRARAAYLWASENVQDGNEGDGRRVITGKSGARQAAFVYLCRLLGIPVDYALGKSRLAMPPVGKMSEVEEWDPQLQRVPIALRVKTEKGDRWLAMQGKFAPFGYLPAELRGQPAIVLVPGLPRVTLPAEGAQDGVRIEGRASLREDGSATIELVQKYSGKLAIGMRQLFEQLPEARRADFVETRILGKNLPSARLRELKIENAKDVTLPLVLRMKVESRELARVSGDRLVVKGVFPLDLTQLATLPTRQTPLLLPSASHVELVFRVVAPSSFKMPSSLPQGEAKEKDRIVRVRDDVRGHEIVLDRYVDIPAGRVQPGAEYASFVRFVREADALLEKDVALGR